MQPPNSYVLLELLLLSLTALSSAADAPKATDKPCSLHSGVAGSFYNLSPLTLFPKSDDDAPSSTEGTNTSWASRGYDYGRNFSLNICAPVVEELKNVDGVNKDLWANVSAFYRDGHGGVISLGQSNNKPIFRGRKLLLNYTQGSPCPELDENGEPVDTSAMIRRLLENPPTDNDDLLQKKGSTSSQKSKTVKRRKSTLLSFICDTAPNLANRPSVSFLGSLDHCTYAFEVRSRWACAGTTQSHESGTLGPGGVFGVISAIAIAVYLIGGIVYQRNVMHQRGWRQLPNYSVWAGLYNFFQDMFIILFSSCARRMPSVARLFGGRRGGYHRVGSDYRSNGSTGRGRSSEDANRLIDSLDEEWD